MFAHSVKLFSLNGFEIKVDPSWLIIAALITWSLSQHYFPEALPDHAASVYLTIATVAMLGFCASLLLHELAHSIVARQLGVTISSITLFVFGGVAELESEPTSARAEFWIALAGPVMSLCLALGFWLLEQIATIFLSSQALVEILGYLALINLVLALFNLVPAFPLDGGRILRSILWWQRGDALSATRAASRSGVFFAYILMGFGIVTLFQGGTAAGLWQILVGGFILIAARASYVQQLAKTAFTGKTVEALMTRDLVTVGPDITLSEFANQTMLHKHVSFVPVCEAGVLLGHIDSAVMSKIDRENWVNTRVGDVFIGLKSDVMITPDTPIETLLQTISTTGWRKFMVVSDHSLLGVITLSDLTQQLFSSDKTAMEANLRQQS